MLTAIDLTRNLPALRRYAKALTHTNGEDLVQDTALQAWRFRDKYVEGNACGWLLHIMYNIHLTNVKREVRQRDAIYPVETTAPETQFINCVVSDVHAAIRKLPQHERDLLLAIMRGNTVVEAADELHIRRTTAFRYAKAGRKQLREVFA